MPAYTSTRLKQNNFFSLPSYCPLTSYNTTTRTKVAHLSKTYYHTSLPCDKVSVVSCQLVASHIVSCHVSSSVMSCCAVSCQDVSVRVVSCRAKLCRVVLCHVLCRVVSCRILSYRDAKHCSLIYPCVHQIVIYAGRD